MKRLTNGIQFLGLLFAGSYCMAQDLTVSVQNSQAFRRTEIVAIQYAQLSKFLKQHPEKDLRVKKEGTAKAVTIQWYQKHKQSPGYYHTDHGEGYDPYQVGNSRGTGGIDVWVNDSLCVWI